MTRCMLVAALCLHLLVAGTVAQAPKPQDAAGIKAASEFKQCGEPRGGQPAV